MTIHQGHPFATPPGDRDPLRRFRGRTPAPVSVWSTGAGAGRAGLTVSSFLVADGEPARVLGLVDEDSELWDAEPETMVVQLLTPGQEYVADVFAGLAPSPGGPFRTGGWTDSAWGPVLAGTAGWLGVRRVPDPPRAVGWGLLVEAVVEHVEVPADPEGSTGPVVLTHLRGRYR